jgi:hypothetical protein
MLVLLGLMGLAGCGAESGGSATVPVARERAVERAGGEAPARVGRWRRLPAVPAQAEQLERIGYVEGSRAPRAEGVWLHEQARLAPGVQLVVSGHHAGAELQTVQGEVLHRWQASWSELAPDDALGRDNRSASFWRRAALLPDGHVLAVFEGLGVARLDRDSAPVWVVANRAHHDLEVVGDQVWVLARRSGVLPAVHPSETVLEDLVLRLDLATGEERQRVSIVEALHAGGFGPVTLSEHAEHRGDLLHTNSLVWLDGALATETPAFARGHLLLSLLARDELAVLDPERGVVTWTLRGEFHRQHDPHPLPGGRLLLFDNQAGPERSRAVIVGVQDGRALWSWDGGPAVGLFSETCGAASPLPGGNVLVVESDGGRAFEVGPTGELWWSWASPHRVGRDGRWVATLFDVVRTPRPAWLDEAAAR